MTNALKLIRAFDTPTPRENTQPIKSRRLRRQEQRDRVALRRRAERVRSAKVNAQK